MKQPKTKPEPKVQVKLSMPESLGKACELTRKRADKTPYDWNGTIVEAVEKANTEFSQFLDQHEAKVQPNVRLSPIDRVSIPNGAQKE
jgi:hypothetical protein